MENYNEKRYVEVLKIILILVIEDEVSGKTARKSETRVLEADC